jgi:glutamate formiminotransferase / 5-formyltetrahydrofolate cyclo-ligase
MALKWIQSVPNFSEGRDREVIAAIIACFDNQSGCQLLDHRADVDHHRLVVSLAGQPDPIMDALMAAAKVTLEKIDLTRHKGSHPRVGAVDVIPFTPLANITLSQCVELAHSFGRRFWEAYRVPVYYYEAAALRPDRKQLEKIRKGQFETLKTEITRDHRKPDVGEACLHPTAGATVIGARKFLVAFNVNLATDDLTVAKAIAAALRSSSGGLQYIKAIGLSLSHRKMVQVSCNVVDFEKNPLYRVLEFIRTEARRWGVTVAETEVYGMVPSAALLDSACYYLQAKTLTSNQVIEHRLLEHMGGSDL